MANLLYLVHRLPYPPNKGDKVRSYHLLRHLAKRHRVWLGTFVDDPDDDRHVETVRALCEDVCAVSLRPGMARFKSLAGLLQGRSLTELYYRSPQLVRWVHETLASVRIDAGVAFSSSMAQYLLGGGELPFLADLVDVDSAKWTQYGDTHAWPMSWIYRREGRKLLDFERAVVRASRRSYLVTRNEVDLFERVAPDCRGKVLVSENGVDSDYFSPDRAVHSPFGAEEVAVVFTGAMDYWPNVDAVCWFAQDMFPDLCAGRPHLRFYIVGRNPTPEVVRLASNTITVTGTVEDVRPYLHHAAVVVAPLRLARGIQNKVLEAMAMGKPVVASHSCLNPIDAEVGVEVLGASTPDEFINQVHAVLDSVDLARAIGSAARTLVLRRYSWDANLAAIDAQLPTAAQGHSGPAVVMQ